MKIWNSQLKVLFVSFFSFFLFCCGFLIHCCDMGSVPDVNIRDAYGHQVGQDSFSQVSGIGFSAIQAGFHNQHRHFHWKWSIQPEHQSKLFFCVGHYASTECMQTQNIFWNAKQNKKTAKLRTRPQQYMFAVYCI